MARTKDEIKAELVDLLPDYVTDWKVGRALAGGLAAVIHKVELAFDANVLEAFRKTATEPFLVALAKEAGVERRPGEPLEDFRARCVLEPRGSIAWLRRELAARLEAIGFEGYNIHVFEPRWTAIENDFFLDDPTTMILPTKTSKAQFWVYIPPVEELPVESTYLGVDAYVADFYLVETARSPRRRVFDEVEELAEDARRAGVGLGILYAREGDGDLPVCQFTPMFAEMEVGFL